MNPDDRNSEFAQNKASLDQRDRLDRAFSSEYAATKQEVRTARQAIKEWNKQISALRAGVGRPDGPQNTMPGAGSVPRQTEDRIRELKHLRNQLRTTTYDKVQAQTRQASPEGQVRMHEAAWWELQKGMSQAARDKQNSARLEPGVASVNRAQDRFFKKATTARRTPDREPTKVAPQPKTAVQQPAPSSSAAGKSSSMSGRFVMTPGYNKSTEPPKAAATKATPSKQLPDSKLSGLSTADRFLNASSLSRAKNTTSVPSKGPSSKAPNKPSKNKGKDDI